LLFAKTDTLKMVTKNKTMILF